MNLQLELRAAEGGADAKLLVLEQARIYFNLAEREQVSAHVVDQGKG